MPYLNFFTCIRIHIRDRSLCRGEGGGEKRRRGREKRRGGQGYFRLARGGRGLNFFIKKLGGGGGQQFEVYSIVRGVHWPRWVKQLNSRVQTLSVKQ